MFTLPYEKYIQVCRLFSIFRRVGSGREGKEENKNWKNKQSRDISLARRAIRQTGKNYSYSHRYTVGTRIMDVHFKLPYYVRRERKKIIRRYSRYRDKPKALQKIFKTGEMKDWRKITRDGRRKWNDDTNLDLSLGCNWPVIVKIRTYCCYAMQRAGLN